MVHHSEEDEGYKEWWHASAALLWAFWRNGMISAGADRVLWDQLMLRDMIKM